MTQSIGNRLVAQSQKSQDNLLEAVVEELEVSDSRYEAAERSYKSVAEWLNRPESALNPYQPDLSVQGSFALGTAIRPLSEDEDYDVDAVCELKKRSKSQVSQAALKRELGDELFAYATSKGMTPPKSKRRCWALNYADDTQFHLDVLPALFDGVVQRVILERANLATEFSDFAIAITDDNHWAHHVIHEEWPSSNPKGYALWFRGRMGALFEAQRRRLALEARAQVQEIPEYRVKTPLQRVVQLLKRHRDVRFSDRPDEKPISIIITTLAAKSYNNQTTLTDALLSVLSGMDQHIERRGEVAWIPNPTDPRENFADKWQTQPGLEAAFYEWLAAARQDFDCLTQETNRGELIEHLSPLLGEAPVSRVAKKLGVSNAISSAIISPFRARHKKAPPWRFDPSAQAKIVRAIVTRNGFRPQEFQSNGSALQKHANLRFETLTDVPAPFNVYWQVVNTGAEADAAGQLRGGFDQGVIEQGTITRLERTAYTGRHTIECFIVKNGLLVARSGPFIVNIA